MTYQINVSTSNAKEFLKIVESLKNSGLVDSIKPIDNSPALPGEPLNDDQLMAIVNKSKEQIKNGNFYTMEEVKLQIESWKNK